MRLLVRPLLEFFFSDSTDNDVSLVAAKAAKLQKQKEHLAEVQDQLYTADILGMSSVFVQDSCAKREKNYSIVVRFTPWK